MVKGVNLMKNNITIAIDGPSGSGKSTIAKALAKKLNILFLSTGSIYRAFGFVCKQNGINPESETETHSVLSHSITIKFIDGKQCVFLDGDDITNQINNEEIGRYASLVSKHKHIREKCVEIQRNIALNQSIVVDGRDIGSVVLPNADFKFYLDADLEQRAIRRFKDLTNSGIKTTLKQVENELRERDYNDLNRKLSPLVQAKDAIKIDSTNLSIEEVVAKFIEIIEK